MMQEDGKFNLFDRVKTTSGCLDFFSEGAIGEVVAVHTGNKLCFVKFSEGDFAVDCDGTWYVKFENLVKLEQYQQETKERSERALSEVVDLTKTIGQEL